MDFHGYCRNLKAYADTLGFEVIEHTLFPYCGNPLNPTAVTIIKKAEAISSRSATYDDQVLVCPKYKTELINIEGMLFSPEALVVYPIIGGIPCLRIENGIWASKYPDFMLAKK
ncbi:hypothetical protein MZ909_00695 [Thermosynechococcus sp. B0]|uniref:hypothetical protein n=1 Tax=unclassified Thermosynechococcus TaxID=2622553 RepID=UPI002576D1B4|nr:MULTISPECIES: hypothetical protein [unclassified Thermosynechococcus]WJI24224.1 hypothetical protein MZ909_00695 [Thermosynechococcus sp. B0]WJI26738.1 hypothetical protein M0644_00690 [Thermosynechococcus sp. B1]WJI29266.1 hypothetical protein M0646_00690 [Thermosynechococcus sp. B3]